MHVLLVINILKIFQTLYKTQVREMKEEKEELEKAIETEKNNMADVRDER